MKESKMLYITKRLSKKLDEKNDDVIRLVEHFIEENEKMKIFQKNDIYEYAGAQIICSEALLADCTRYIKSKVNRMELLGQLMEECSELIQTSAKLIRTEPSSNNPSPISPIEAEKNFTEEQLDVISVLWLLTDSKMYEHIRYYPKYVRWAIRLGYQIPAEYIVDGDKRQIE